MKNVSRDEHFLQKIKFYCPPFLYKTRKSNVSYVSVCHQPERVNSPEINLKIQTGKHIFAFNKNVNFCLPDSDSVW